MNNLTQEQVSDYLLGDEYRELLKRAIYSRCRTTSKFNLKKHTKAVWLIEEYEKLIQEKVNND
jgi:hypothetical protein